MEPEVLMDDAEMELAHAREDRAWRAFCELYGPNADITMDKPAHKFVSNLTIREFCRASDPQCDAVIQACMRAIHGICA